MSDVVVETPAPKGKPKKKGGVSRKPVVVAVPEKAGHRGEPGMGDHAAPIELAKKPVGRSAVESSETASGRERSLIYGQRLTAVFRQLGSKGWKPKEVKALCSKMGIPTSDNTIISQVGQFATRGELAALSGEQIRALAKIAGK